MKKSFIFPILFILLLLLQSCLTYRSIEYRIIFNENFDQGKIAVNYNDIQSSENEIEKQEKDFKDLIELLFGDEFLLDNVDEGIYVKDRKLWKEDGILKATFNGIFKELKLDDSELKIENEERILILKNDGDTYECNGKVLQTEKNVIMVWPKDQKELYWKQIIDLDDEPTFPLIRYYEEWAQNNR
jgi:hypothetical protein